MRLRKKRSALLIAPAVALTFAVPVYASDTSSAQREPGQTSATNSVPAESKAMAGDVRASRLIGMEVWDPSGQALGEIEDTVIDLSEGRVRYAVLSTGGFLDIGAKHHVYRLDQFSKAPGGEHLVLNADADSLMNAPSFDSDGWPGFKDPFWSGMDDGSDAQARRGETDLRRVSEVLGIDLKNPSGVEIGELQDFAIDLQSGEARAILAFDPGEEADERLVAVPPARLGIPSEGNAAVVNMTRTELMDAPRVTDTES